jgi:polysaccharide export outer membrane protein
MASPAPEAPAAVTVTIPLDSLTDFGSLDSRPETNEAIDAARRYPTSPLYLAAYAATVDVAGRPGDATRVSNELVVRMARYLAQRGIAPERISGRGMGANDSVGRAVVVSLDVAATPGGLQPSARQVAEREAAQKAPDRLPSQNRSFKEVGGAAAYRVGAGDQLKITNWMVSGAKQYDVVVNSAGAITFDLIEGLPVAGLTTDEIESLIANALRRYYRSPRISVGVAAFKSRTITLIGPDGAKSVTLEGRTTVLDLVAREQLQGRADANAITGTADLKDVRVVRGQKQFDVNLFKVVLDRDWSENLVLDDGDVVYLSTFGESGNYVMVLGNVVRPGIYPMRTRLGAHEALYLAGGPSPGAYLPHARIVRGDLQKPEILAADVDRVVNDGELAARKELRSGDILFVPASRISNWNAFIADMAPTIQLISAPLQGTLGASLLFNRSNGNDTIIVNPTQGPGPMPTSPLPIPTSPLPMPTLPIPIP